MGAPKTSGKGREEVQRMRDVFARNIKAALEERGLTVNAETARQAKAMGFEIQGTTVRRATEGKHAPTLDTIYILSRVTGYDPWQLLTASFDPANPPIVREVTEAEKEFYRRFFQTKVTP